MKKYIEPRAMGLKTYQLKNNIQLQKKKILQRKRNFDNSSNR